MLSQPEEGTITRNIPFDTKTLNNETNHLLFVLMFGIEYMCNNIQLLLNDSFYWQKPEGTNVGQVIGTVRIKFDLCGPIQFSEEI